MAIVYIPAALRELTGGIDRLEVDAASVRQIVAVLEARWPALEGRLRQGDELAGGLAVSIDGAISARGLLAKVRPDSEVHFIPAIGGG
jgi:molybdopterin synthase sulfur carrier subunit